jgi:hypothetical protein
MFSTGQNLWDSDINSLGGIKNVTLYESCYSNNASANAQQGKISSGVNSIIFEPPKLDLTTDVPRESGYLGNRIMVDYNKMQRIYEDGVDALATINEKPELEGKSTAEAVADKVAYASVAPAKITEPFASVPGLVDSHFLHESYKERASMMNMIKATMAKQAAADKEKAAKEAAAKKETTAQRMKVMFPWLKNANKATFDNPASCGCRTPKKRGGFDVNDKSLRVAILLIIIFFVFSVCFLCNQSLHRLKYLIMNYFSKDATVNTNWSGTRGNPTARIPQGYESRQPTSRPPFTGGYRGPSSGGYKSPASSSYRPSSSSSYRPSSSYSANRSGSSYSSVKALF